MIEGIFFCINWITEIMVIPYSCSWSFQLFASLASSNKIPNNRQRAFVPSVKYNYWKFKWFFVLLLFQFSSLWTWIKSTFLKLTSRSNALPNLEKRNILKETRTGSNINCFIVLQFCEKLSWLRTLKTIALKIIAGKLHWHTKQTMSGLMNTWLIIVKKHAKNNQQSHEAFTICEKYKQFPIKVIKKLMKT